VERDPRLVAGVLDGHLVEDALEFPLVLLGEPVAVGPVDGLDVDVLAVDGSAVSL
jgi:hypothetical protein